MTPSSSPRINAMASKRGVRGAYTLEYVRQDVLRQRNALDEKGNLTSWRKIAKRYGISHASIYRLAMYGTNPKDPEIRKALNLPEFVSVEPCARCGHVHVTKRCTDKTQPTKYAPHPVMRVTAIRRLLQNPYLQS